MRVALLGGTRFVGAVIATRIGSAGHTVAIAHTGRHEHPSGAGFEHLHGERGDLLRANGPIERWRPDAIVDLLPGGATREKGSAVVAAATRCDARIVAISSIDVYRYCVDAGFGDGSGELAVPRDPVPLGEDAVLRDKPYPGSRPGHDNVAMESALHSATAAVVLRPGAIYGPHASVREAFFVDRVRRGVRSIPLPSGRAQVLHPVSVERVAAAALAALEQPRVDGFRAYNVVDPVAWSYMEIADHVGEILGWRWRTVPAGAESDHPWNVRHPIVCSDLRLRRELRVDEPDQLEAFTSTIRWLWENRDNLPSHKRI